MSCHVYLLTSLVYINSHTQIELRLGWYLSLRFSLSPIKKGNGVDKKNAPILVLVLKCFLSLGR